MSLRDISELSKAVQYGEVFSEGRAILDYPMARSSEALWIQSHERLRRKLEDATKQKDALQRQAQETSKAYSELDREVITLRQQKTNLQKQIDKLEKQNGGRTNGNHHARPESTQPDSAGVDAGR